MRKRPGPDQIAAILREIQADLQVGLNIYQECRKGGIGRQFVEDLADREMGVIAALGSRVLRLLTPLPLGSLGVVLGIIQRIGALVPWSGFGASSKQIGLELTFFALELIEFLLQRGDALQGIAMATLPIPDLLAELEILALQAMDLSAERVNFPAQVLHQSYRFCGRGARATWTGALKNGRSRATTQEEAARS